MGNDRDEFLATLRIYYENHNESKDNVIFPEMQEKFGTSVRSLKRYKKKFGWLNKVKTGKTSKAPIKAKPTAPNIPAAKSTPPKKRTDHFAPDKPKLMKIEATGHEVDRPASEIRQEQIYELIRQGAGLSDIKNFIADAKKNRVADRNIWREYIFEEHFIEDYDAVLTVYKANYELDAEFEQALFFERNNYLYAQAVRYGHYGLANSISKDRWDFIAKMNGTYDVRRLASVQKEHNLSMDDIIKIIEEHKALQDESIPE